MDKKAIFLCENKEKIPLVYNEDVRRLLSLDGEIYNKAAVLSSPKEFKHIEYVFSTWGMSIFSEEEIKTCFPSLKAVFYAAGSVQEFALPFINQGVKVYSAWKANAIPVIEFTLAQIILANKGYFQTQAYHSVGDTDTSRRERWFYPGNFNTTVGIIGLGVIGKGVLERLKDYNLNVVVFDAFLSSEQIESLGAKKVNLEELFECSNIITNHLANNEQTRGMLNYKLFSKMMPYSTFINTGRGAQVVEKDLVRVLSERKDIAALLDVTEPEPPLKGHKFYELKNCFLSPHIAGSSGNEVARMGEYMYNAYIDFINGGKNQNEVTMEMLKTMA